MKLDKLNETYLLLQEIRTTCFHNPSYWNHLGNCLVILKKRDRVYRAIDPMIQEIHRAYRRAKWLGFPISLIGGPGVYYADFLKEDLDLPLWNYALLFDSAGEDSLLSQESSRGGWVADTLERVSELLALQDGLQDQSIGNQLSQIERQRLKYMISYHFGDPIKAFSQLKELRQEQSFSFQEYFYLLRVQYDLLEDARARYRELEQLPAPQTASEQYYQALVYIQGSLGEPPFPDEPASEPDLFYLYKAAEALEALTQKYTFLPAHYQLFRVYASLEQWDQKPSKWKKRKNYTLMAIYKAEKTYAKGGSAGYLQGYPGEVVALEELSLIELKTRFQFYPELKPIVEDILSLLRTTAYKRHKLHKLLGKKALERQQSLHKLFQQSFQNLKINWKDLRKRQRHKAASLLEAQNLLVRDFKEETMDAEWDSLERKRKLDKIHTKLNTYLAQYLVSESLKKDFSPTLVFGFLLYHYFQKNLNQEQFTLSVVFFALRIQRHFGDHSKKANKNVKLGIKGAVEVLKKLAHLHLASSLMMAAIQHFLENFLTQKAEKRTEKEETTIDPLTMDFDAFSEEFYQIDLIDPQGNWLSYLESLFPDSEEFSPNWE